jgi:hypothetical protein
VFGFKILTQFERGVVLRWGRMHQAGVSAQAAIVGPGSAVLRSIAGPAAKHTARVGAPARPALVSGQATGAVPSPRPEPSGAVAA